MKILGENAINAILTLIKGNEKAITTANEKIETLEESNSTFTVDETTENLLIE